MFLYVRLYCMLVFLGAVLVLQSSARTVTLKNADPQSVQNAVDFAADGDVIELPSGKTVWKSPVIIKNRAVTIIGKGIDKTILVDSTGTKWKEAPFWIEGVEGKPVRISGITFIGSSTQANINIKGNCRNWRIDNCKFDATTRSGRGVWVHGYGLIDHCIFINTTQGISVFGDGDDSWKRPLSLGSEHAVYVEDCVFDYDDNLDGALDAYDGARYVFRYNKVVNTMIGHHGLDSGGKYRSTFSCEIYKNTFTTNLKFSRAIGSRGGTGVVYDNTLTGDWGSHPYEIRNYRSCKSYENWGKCDGKNPIDGNEDATGYPCKDQIGRATDQADGKQCHEPLYEWNNVCNGKDIDVTVDNWADCENPSMYDHIKEKRDYFNDTPRPGYRPFTYPHPLTNPPTDIKKNELTADNNHTLHLVKGKKNISTEELDGVTQVEIYNVQGKRLTAVAVEQRDIYLDIDSFAPKTDGCYILLFKTPSGNKIKRLFTP